MTKAPDNSVKYWFPAKRYGWGWGLPTRWQGWLTLALFVVGVVSCSVWLRPAQQPGEFIAGILALGALVLLVCWRKGEPPRWRWGEDANRRS